MHGIDDENLYARALNLLSHGKYSVYEPKEMVEDNKKLFKDILYIYNVPNTLPDFHGCSYILVCYNSGGALNRKYEYVKEK